MKKYLKIMIVIGLAIIGLVLLYEFVVIPREEAKKLESAEREAFFECDKRWTKVSSQVVTQQIFQVYNSSCQQRKLQQDKFNTDIENGSYPEDLKRKLKDYTMFDFYVDEPAYCFDGNAQILDRDSYVGMCKIWYLINIGLTPSSVKYYPQVKEHYH